jgi:hypothetical protein
MWNAPSLSDSTRCRGMTSRQDLPGREIGRCGNLCLIDVQRQDDSSSIDEWLNCGGQKSGHGKPPRHSRAGGKPVSLRYWFPACAGMTKIAALIEIGKLFWTRSLVRASHSCRARNSLSEFEHCHCRSHRFIRNRLFARTFAPDVTTRHGPVTNEGYQTCGR